MVKLDHSFYKNAGLTGLLNLGNTCYINSVVQCLSNCLPLTDYLLTTEIKSEKKVVISFIKTLKEIWDAHESGLLAPRSLKKAIQEVLPDFKGPCDAHEFLLAFLDILHEEVKIKKVFFDISKAPVSKHLKASEKYFFDTIKANSIISELFYGEFLLEMNCKQCDYIHRNYQIFNNIGLSLGTSNKSSIKSLLKIEFSKNYRYFSCEKCGNPNFDVEHSVNTKIIKFPEILVVYLKRFRINNGKTLKLNDPVELSKELDLSNYTYTYDKSQSVCYKLRSVICHTQEQNYDHYYALVKRNKKWIKYDDADVTLDFDIKELNLSDPYIVFYEKREI